jgi:hypothetical protein
VVTAIDTGKGVRIFHNFMHIIIIIIIIDIGSGIAVCTSQGMKVTAVKTNPG